MLAWSPDLVADAGRELPAAAAVLPLPPLVGDDAGLVVGAALLLGTEAAAVLLVAAVEEDAHLAGSGEEDVLGDTKQRQKNAKQRQGVVWLE